AQLYEKPVIYDPPYVYDAQSVVLCMDKQLLYHKQLALGNADTLFLFSRRQVVVISAKAF
ncbi:MAG: hypothetical protein JAY69_15895, partial [Candidatus Thiodiazotropha taylori]|nr:hypothetical protein [Candidatus Thiodiazotropha taylori]MCW4234108.1 hypothetical protein [Candidatus Thiodiazotropha taylori]